MKPAIYYRRNEDRWIKGDQYVRRIIRRIVRREDRLSGIQKVVYNFKKGLDLLNIEYSFNKPFCLLKDTDIVISFGWEKTALQGYRKKNPIIAAIGFPYPAEWPDLCEKYPVKRFLQHSEWVLNYIKLANLYPESIFGLWPAGIDTYEWQPDLTVPKTVDLLVYNKIRWNHEKMDNAIRLPIFNKIKKLGLTHKEIIYGYYHPREYKMALAECRAMVFLVEHESQGFACQECLSCNVPIFAWDQGLWLDPLRLKYNRPIVPATSVPFFDERCGMKFKHFEEFEKSFPLFLDKVLSNQFSPREYILENLTLEKSAKKMLDIQGSLLA